MNENASLKPLRAPDKRGVYIHLTISSHSPLLVLMRMTGWGGVEGRDRRGPLCTPVFLSGESHGQKILRGYSPQGHESQT